MKTVLFLDVENMGGALVRKAVDFLIQRFTPSRKEIVYSTATHLPSAFRNIDGWSVYRCNPGKNAADEVIKKHIVAALKDDGVKQVILVTSDHGFANICRKIVAAGRKLLLVVKQLGRLSKSVLTHCAAGADVFEVSDVHTPTQRSSVFVKDRLGGLHEVVFSNGMTVGAFVNALKEAGAYRKRITHWAKEMFLNVEDGRVYIATSKILAAA